MRNQLRALRNKLRVSVLFVFPFECNHPCFRVERSLSLIICFLAIKGVIEHIPDNHLSKRRWSTEKHPAWHLACFLRWVTTACGGGPGGFWRLPQGQGKIENPRYARMG